MPLFEYRCSVCQERFEELVSFSQSNDVECPKCGSKDTKKLVSTFATISGGSTGNSGDSCSGSSGYT